MFLKELFFSHKAVDGLHQLPVLVPDVMLGWHCVIEGYPEPMAEDCNASREEANFDGQQQCGWHSSGC